MLGHVRFSLAIADENLFFNTETAKNKVFNYHLSALISQNVFTAISLKAKLYHPSGKASGKEISLGNSLQGILFSYYRGFILIIFSN